MDNKRIKKINTAGTVGYVICILLIIGSIACMVGVAIGTAGAAVVSSEDINVSISTGITADSKGDFFGKLNHFIKMDGVEDLSDLITEDGKVFTPDDKDISEISVKKQGNGLALNAKFGEKKFTMKRIIFSLTVTFFYLGAITVTLFMLKALMKALKECDTPFSADVVTRMNTFAKWLIPTTVLHIFNSSAWGSVGSDSSFSLTLNLGVVMLVAVVFLIVYIFRYGADLQKESDETL